MKGTQVCSNEGPYSFPWGDNKEITKIYGQIFFKLLLQNIWPISNKLGTRHPWVEGIQICSNEGSRPFPRGDNNEIGKIHLRNLKNNWANFKLRTKHALVKGIHVFYK